MIAELRRGLVFTVVMMALLGGAYHVAIWGVAQVLFPRQAEGSLIRRADGTLAGSRLIAQAFTRDEYFRPRPSAVDYDAAAAGGSNDSPSNPDHLKAVRERLAAVEAREGVPADRVPAEMVTASGSGLDPHISPDAAELQARRVARARGADIERVRVLIREHTEPPAWGFLGRARVNVLELNMALDQTLGARK